MCKKKIKSTILIVGLYDLKLIAIGKEMYLYKISSCCQIIYFNMFVNDNFANVLINTV